MFHWGQAAFFRNKEIAMPWLQRHLAGGIDESSPYRIRKSSLLPFYGKAACPLFIFYFGM